MCVTVRTLCLLVSSVSVILSVARAVIHDMLHLVVHQGCDPFEIIPQSHKMVMMSVPRLDTPHHTTPQRNTTQHNTHSTRREENDLTSDSGGERIRSTSHLAIIDQLRL